MPEKDYNVVLDAAAVIFDIEVSNDVMLEITDEIEDTIDMVECYFERGQISIVTKFGDDWDFWQERLPKIDKIVKKHLNAR